MRWAKMKGEVAQYGNTLRTVYVDILMNKALDRVTMEEWAFQV
jgi:hypothetical protein